jgi:hypothetical protein
MDHKCGCSNCNCKTFVDTQMTESVLIDVTDNMGRIIFWEDAGRPLGE